jgi:hypothetical protein
VRNWTARESGKPRMAERMLGPSSPSLSPTPEGLPNHQEDKTRAPATKPAAKPRIVPRTNRFTALVKLREA